MPGYGLTIALAAAVAIAAIPYVRWIRHPAQKPVAAYVIFVTVFMTSAAVLITVLAWLAAGLDLADRMQGPGPAILALVIVVAAALWLATWQARKPPLRHGPPG